MKTIILSYVIALGGAAMIVFGIYSLIRERVAELGLRGYVPAIQTIAVGFVLIGLARALQLLLLVFAVSPHIR
jgi:ABC-type glucose/galactose transport system permease subunit